MNKGLHRTVFSKKHNTMVAVAETANSQGKGKQAGTSAPASPQISDGLYSKLKTTLKTLVCSLVSLSMVLPAHAQITTDKSAPKNQQVVILKTNTGAPLVNIQTPNGRGLSHNRYTQFDVDNKGAVLNNDRNNNPFLVKGGAQLILNEVRGTASKLNGIVTVGGQKADVIIANPNGITVNGGGFKNVGRGILTTGAPQIGKDGALTGFDVRQGTLTVGAAGWNDKGGADYTEILARAVALQGKLQGKNLAVSTGPQKVDYASGEISAGTAAGTKPTIALDTAALGGMYADSITLIANEKGVGVKNAGTLEAAKQLIVTSSGRIENSGRIATTADSTEASPTYLSIETTETGAAGAFISNGGRIESKGLLVIDTGEDIGLRNGAVVQNNGNRPAATVLNAGRNLVIESKANVNNAKGSTNLSTGGRTTINDATIQAGSSVYSSTKGDTELGENTRIIAENVTVLSNGSIGSAAVIEAKDTAHIEAGKPLSLETSNVASNIRLNNGSIKGGKQVVLMADDDIQAKASHLNASGNLYIHAGKDLDLNADKDLSTQSISLRADNTALISSNGNTLTAEKNLDIQAGSLSVRQSNLQSSGGNVQMSATKGNISLNQSWINASQNIDTAALQGNIISDGLTAVAEVGRVSLLANGNVDFNGLNTLIAEGDINAGSVGKGRLKMDNTDIYASAGDVKLVAGGQLDLGNGTVNGGHISLDSNKGSMVVQNVHLNARASLKVDADQTLTINNSKLNSDHNTQINTNHGHMTLNQLDAHSRRHMSISAQGKGKGKDSGQILQNDQQNSKSTLAADGVLSLNSSALQVLDNTTLRGGAINIKAGGGIIKRGHIDWETQDTATMRSAELKPLSGMMSIESGGDNPLTVEPGNRIVSAGDLAVKHNGTFQISARAGNNGNPSAQTASVSAKGNIGIVAGEVDIDAANIAAGKDLALVATKGNISLNSIRNTFSNYQLKTDKHNITQQLTDVEQELSKLTSDPKYRKAQDLPQMLRRKYKRRDKVFGDSEARLRGLRAKINAADEAWAERQSPVKALLERKQLLQQALLTVSQPGSGHENQGSTLSGQNIKLLAAGGIRIQGSKVAATQQANIQAAGFLPAPAAEELQEGRLQSAIDISGVLDTFEYGQQGSDKYGYAIFSRPSEISGKTGVTLSAPYANENSRILLSTTDISSENGKIKIQSYGDQYYYARQSELYTFERRSYKTGKWYNRKHITEVKEHKNAKPDAVNLSASQGIDIKSGGSIDAYATAFDAPKGSINIEAGRKLTLYAVEELNYDKLDSQKRRRFLGISYSKAHDTTTQVMKTALPSRVVAESANLQSGWDTKLQGTQFETTLGGATIRAGVGEQARADAKIILEGIKTTIHNETVSSSKSALWQKQAGRGSNIETLQLPSFTGPVAPVLSAPGGYIADIPKGNLKTEIETLTKQPEYAYLKQLQVAKNINWNQVQLAYDKWDYKQEGLTEAGAAIIALAVTVVTSGAGTGAVLGLNGAAAAATDAAFASLASQASVSFINNKGDVGKTLKELGRSSTVKNLVVAAATAGVADKIGASALNNVSDKQWINNLTVNLANAGSAALINTAVNGGSLKDNLEANILAALVNTAHGEAASKIKQLDQHYIVHKIAHAIAGCAAAAANKGKCQDGAIGAAVGEIVGEALVKNTDFSRMSATEIEKAKAKITAYAKLVAGATVGVTGGNVDVAANASETAVKNNALDIIWDIGNLVWDGGKWIYAKSIGDKQMAREAAIDFGVDAAAAAVPFVPAGATKISRGRAYVLKAGDEAVDTAKAIQEIQKQTGIKLTYDKVNKVWTTPAGLDYGLDAKHGNRIKHVLAHTIPNPNKPVHSVFNVSRKEVLPLVDEAWRMKGNPLPNDSSVYLVDMKKPIGTKGETKVRIVVQKGTNKIISAYPQK
ncbi:two-partner secretion domain-containing protein [Neisseria meningitidis]|uniref:two-partner secretion domain-containing protein n=1 Tax=Neisseria meningitidis TaxID=487 RepID=UPI003FA11BD6